MYVYACMLLLVLINGVASWWGVESFGGLLYLGASYIFGALYTLGGLIVWGFFALGVFDGFLILCCFDVFLIFWGLLFFDFLMLFWWFLDFSTIFFSGFCFAFTHQKRYNFWNSLAILFFWSILAPLWWGDAQKVTAQSFAALGLVFNRICESIKKYKTWWLGFSSYPCLQVASLIFSGSTL